MTTLHPADRLDHEQLLQAASLPPHDPIRQEVEALLPDADETLQAAWRRLLDENDALALMLRAPPVPKDPRRADSASP